MLGVVCCPVNLVDCNYVELIRRIGMAMCLVQRSRLLGSMLVLWLFGLGETVIPVICCWVIGGSIVLLRSSSVRILCSLSLGHSIAICRCLD